MTPTKSTFVPHIPRNPTQRPKIFVIEINGKPYKWAPTGIKALAICRIDKLEEYTIVEWDYDQDYDDPSNVVRHMKRDN